jgi:hypothetical protein
METTMEPYTHTRITAADIVSAFLTVLAACGAACLLLDLIGGF